jgi:hypothetical protein
MFTYFWIVEESSEVTYKIFSTTAPLRVHQVLLMELFYPKTPDALKALNQISPDQIYSAPDQFLKAIKFAS